MDDEVREMGQEFVISHRGEPDIDIKMHRARPSSDAEIYLEVLVTAHADDGETSLETTDLWARNS